MWLEEQSRLAQHEERRIREAEEVRRIEQTRCEQAKMIERYLVDQRLARARVERIMRAEKARLDGPRKFARVRPGRQTRIVCSGDGFW